MIDSAKLDGAIVAAHQACRPPFRVGRSFEEQSAVWLIQYATDRALAAVFEALTDPQEVDGTAWRDPDFLRAYRERIIARAAPPPDSEAKS